MLADFIAAHLKQPWQPGKVDCLLVLADWCVWLGHPDPVADFRGSYDSEAEFQAIIARAGGAIPLVADCAARIGLMRADVPAHGFIGIVGSRTDIQRQWGAIFDAGALGWRVRFRDGFPALKARPLAMWSI